MRRLLVITVTFLITIGEAVKAQQMGSVDFYQAQARFNMKMGNVEQAVILYAQAVDRAKEMRSAGKGVNGALLAEYAYALALHHDYEAALVNIDRAIMLNASNGVFFAGQILIVMGYGQAAFQLTGQTPEQYVKVPRPSDWIDGIYPNLNRKYSAKIPIIRTTPKRALERASALPERGQTVMAIVLYEELMEKYPDQFVIPASYSTLWEKLGKRTYAASLLKRSISLMGMADSASRVAFMEHLDNMESAPMIGLSSLTKNVKMITYVGASIGKGMTSINGRVGVCTEEKFSTSLNANVMFWNKQTTGNVGISAYKTWSIFVFGLGVSKQLAKTTKDWGLAPSIGLSFINKSQTASFDIIAAGQIPFKSETSFSYNLSLGTTFYLDFRKDKK